jgi:hypothetical protein
MLMLFGCLQPDNNCVGNETENTVIVQICEPYIQRKYVSTQRYMTRSYYSFYNEGDGKNYTFVLHGCFMEYI